MKKNCFVAFLCLTALSAWAQYGTQFENRGFETWANFTPNNNSSIEPVHWHSTKSATGSFTGFLSQQVEPSDIVRPGTHGTKSARLWPRSVVGVTVNGNLTNGRMNAGSMSATGTGNYNYTQRADEQFNTPIQRVPDSLAVWVCFRSTNPEQKAEAKAVVHGDADFRLVANGTVDPLDQRVAVATATFIRTSEAGGPYYWRRISVPFERTGPCNDPQYILFTITTNEVPGQGGTADDLFVDDILLIYNPSVQLGSIEKDTYHLGEALDIPFTLDGTFSPDNLDREPNHVIAQLSSANGSFSTPIELGRVVSDVSGTIHASIPMTIAPGDHYRIRVVTSNYPMISEDNGFDLHITSGAALAEQPNPSVRLYPNPAGSFFRVTSSQEMTGIELYDLAGAKVLSQPAEGKEIELSTASLAAGVYTAHCHFHQQTLFRKLVIQ